MTPKKLRALMNNPASAVQLRFGNQTALEAAEKRLKQVNSAFCATTIQ
jgi:hypothetical protein